MIERDLAQYRVRVREWLRELNEVDDQVAVLGHLIWVAVVAGIYFVFVWAVLYDYLDQSVFTASQDAQLFLVGAAITAIAIAISGDNVAWWITERLRPHFTKDDIADGDVGDLDEWEWVGDQNDDTEGTA